MTKVSDATREPTRKFPNRVISHSERLTIATVHVMQCRTALRSLIDSESVNNAMSVLNLNKAYEATTEALKVLDPSGSIWRQKAEQQ